jgi:TetR/AcrR family transcriptional regulator, tetracycline repressor protein
MPPEETEHCLLSEHRSCQVQCSPVNTPNDRIGADGARRSGLRRRVAGWATGAPTPTWWGDQREPLRRRPLTRDAILRAALAIIDSDGLAGLSMRKVADRLEASAGALYSHVANKRQLLELIVDRVFEGLEVPEADAADWPEQVKQMCRDIRDRLRSHQDLAQVMLGRVPVGPSFVTMLEQQLAFLSDAGVPDRLAAYVGDLLGLYVAAFTFEESLWEREEAENHVDQVGAYLQTLPADRFPHIAAVRDVMTGIGHDERFELGLDIILQGVARLSSMG